MSDDAAKSPRGAHLERRRRRAEYAAEIITVGAIVVAGITLRLSLTAHQWVFAGSDSYGYLSIADEWRRAHRFAFGPPPLPLEWYRRPLYPLFLIFARGDAPALPTGGSGWWHIQAVQLAVEAFVGWPLIFLACRRAAGRVAAVTALLLAALYPPSAPFALAVLTESLAMWLAVLTVAPLLVWRSTRPRLAAAVSAIGVALSALLRPDGLVVGVAILPAFLFAESRPVRLRVTAGAVFSAVFLVLFAPWPVRNMMRFGSVHLSDGMIDRFGNDVPNYSGFWNWIRSWSADETAAGLPASCYYDNICDSRVELFSSSGAFDAPATTTEDERRLVRKILEERHRAGLMPSVDAQFEELARARRKVHPFRVLIALPVRRTVRAWWGPQNELAQNSIAWPRFFRDLIPSFKSYGRSLYSLTLFAIGFLLLIVPHRRVDCLVLAVPLVTRSLALGWTGFSLPRYVAPSYPLCFMLIGIALGTAAAALSPRSKRWFERSSDWIRHLTRRG